MNRLSRITVRTYFPFILGLLLQLPGLSFGQKVDYANIPDHTWVLLDQATYENVEQYPPWGIQPFCGMALDTKHHKLLLFGGGHSAYAGNEVWAWDIEVQTWEKMYEPDSLYGMSLIECRLKVDNKNFPGMWMPSGRPIPRHTYDSVEFLTHAGIIIIGGASTWNNPWGYDNLWECYPLGPFDTWTFDPETIKWTYRTTSDGISVGLAAYDPDSKLLIAVGAPKANPDDTLRYNPGALGIYVYDLNAGKWIRRMDDPGISGHSVMTLDTKRKQAYIYGGDYPSSNDLWSYHLAANTIENIQTRGSKPSPAGMYGLTYDTTNDVVIAFGVDGLFVYRPDTKTWEKNPGSPGINPIKDGTSTNVFGRFKYDPITNLCFLVSMRSNGLLPNVWAYRYKKSNLTDVKHGKVTKPGDFELSQNYPNPFNPETRISYILPKAAQVAVKIYDVLGAELTSLVNRFQNPGKYEVRWDARTAEGAEVPSGVYVYKIVVDKHVVATKKMILLR